VVKSPVGRHLVLTADVIAPLVDDPTVFGMIAAANSLSDVWAMGGEPRFALNLAFFPDDLLPLEILEAIQAGSAMKCAEAGVLTVGGHTVRDAEIKFGLSVTGEVDPDQMWSNRTAKAGQALVVTKALGTGVIGQAIKKGIASELASKAAIASMTTLNLVAARIGHTHRATSATDVTGFGLLGHLRNILHGSNLAATIELDTVPLLPEVKKYLVADMLPGGSKANRRTLVNDIAWADGSAFAAERENDTDRELVASLTCDAQTSGGLLLCLAEERVSACLSELRDAGLPAARIGTLFERTSQRTSIALR